MRYLALPLALLFAGCNATSGDAQHGSMTNFDVALAPLSAEASADPAARAEAAEQAMRAAMVTTAALNDAVSWEEASERAKNALAANPDIRTDVLAPTLSAALLGRWLLPATTPEMKREAAHQATVLIDNRSPELALIAQALEDARSEIPPDMLKDLASRGAELARAVVERQAECDDCDPRVFELNSELRVRKEAQQPTALERLEALASSG